MQLEIVNVFTEEEDSAPRFTLLVAHEKRTKDFQRDWFRAWKKVSNKDPEWNVADIEKLLEGWGWRLFKLPVTEVEY